MLFTIPGLFCIQIGNVSNFVINSSYRYFSKVLEKTKRMVNLPDTFVDILLEVGVGFDSSANLTRSLASACLPATCSPILFLFDGGSLLLAGHVLFREPCSYMHGIFR